MQEVSQVYDPNITDSQIKIIGDFTTICQIVKLLAYIRYAINNNEQTEFTVNIGKKLVNRKLMFDVNGSEVPDIISQKTIEIN